MNDLNEPRQTTIGGNSYGPLLSGRFEGPVGVSSQFNIYLDQVYPRVKYYAEIADLIRFYSDAFVGRKEAIGELLNCVTRREPGYCLVEAPPGYGKTALIVQLIYQHKHNRWPNGKPTLLFHFVRQEGRRNTARDSLRSLNSQLLTTLNLPGGVPTEIEALFAQFIDLWSGAVQLADGEHPLILLVDGLDEMSTLEPTVAQVLPTLLTPYVHVVVTSRQNPAALEQVRIEHPFRQAQVIHLQQFGHTEVEELLNLYRDPVSRDALFVEQLLHLTQGEPLFLRFLCQQVAEWGEKAKDKLTTLPKLKGVEDYFRQQLRQLLSNDN